MMTEINDTENGGKYYGAVEETTNDEGLTI